MDMLHKEHGSFELRTVVLVPFGDVGWGSGFFVWTRFEEFLKDSNFCIVDCPKGPDEVGKGGRVHCQTSKRDEERFWGAHGKWFRWGKRKGGGYSR